MKVLVTGATGFTGSYVVPLLLDKGYSVRCLARPSSKRAAVKAEGVEWVLGDLGDLAALKSALEGVDALANVASIGFGHAPGIVKAAKEAKVERTIFISTTAIFTSLNAPSKAIRMAAEEEIQKSGLAHTILRPTMIYGSSRDRNMGRLVQYLQKFRGIPVFGTGNNLQQPVFVRDVAQAIVECIGKENTVGRAYNIPGAHPLSFNDVIDTICHFLGRKAFKVHVPAMPIVTLLKYLESHGITFPIKAEQILRLNEDKTFSYREAERDFGYSPRAFKEGIAQQLEEMGATC